jgi:hypothetical protein
MNSFREWTVAFLGGVFLFACNSMADEARFVHKDWELVCDNTRTCRAAGYQADGDERLVSMLLTREAGPNTPVSMELQLVAGDEGGVPTEVRLQVGELLFSNIAVGEELPQETAAKLLAVMPDEEKMILTADSQQWKLSLAGLKAVLLKMDDKQGRIGTPGALAAKGNRPEQHVLPPIPMKTLIVPIIPSTTKEDEKVLAALKDFLDAECAEKDAYLEDACKTERVINRLSKDKLLISLLVDRASYNQTVAVWIINDKPPYNPAPATATGLVYDVASENIEFEGYNKGVLHSSTRNNLGDCWNISSWVWTGNNFEKAAESPAGMCKGFGGGAWYLPTFVSKVVNKNDKVKK